MNPEAIQVLTNALSRGELVLSRSPTAWRELAADLFYFILLFGLGSALLVWRVILRPNEPAQMRWDLLFAILFLASAGLVAGKIWWLLHCSSAPVVIGTTGIERKGRATQLVVWPDVSEVYIMPFVVVARSAKGGWIAVGSYTAGFSVIKNLFEAIVALGSKSQSARLGSRQQIADTIERLYRGYGGRT
jgi:hypothetical protein